MSLDLQLQTKMTDSGLYEVTYCRPAAPLDVQEDAFISRGLVNVSPAELAFLRVHVRDGTFDSCSRTRARVVHDDRDGGKGFVIFPNGLGTLVKTADIVDAHRNLKDYVIPEDKKDLVYNLIDDDIKKGVAVRVGYSQVGYSQTIVLTKEFSESKLTLILYREPTLGGNAQAYASHMNEKEQNWQSFFFDSRRSAIRNGLYVNGLNLFGSADEFFVINSLRTLDCDGYALGVRFKKIAEGDAKNPEAHK